MRLTLRTLLSWKDGMLAPDAAGELAAKIEASDAARRLVERIDEVAARPTLAAAHPDAAGFAGSANSTAEYLDNVMPAERIGEFEQVCYTSDAQLAETAATHELLAAWSREPAAALDAATRRRLLAAVRGRATGQGVAGGGADGVEPAAGVAIVPTATPPRAPLRAAPTSAWLLVVAALALLATLVGVLGWSLWRPARIGGGAPRVAARQDAPDAPAPGAELPAVPAPESAPAVANPDPRVPPPEAHVPDASPATAPPIQPPAPPPVQAPDAIAPAADDVPPFGTERDTPNAAAPLQAEVVVPAPPAAVPAGDRLVPQGAALAIAAPPVPAVPDAGPASAPSPPRAAADRDAADCRIAGTDVLLHRPVGADADAWVVGGEGTPLELPIDLVAPPFSRSQLVVDDTTITLQPGTRAVLTRDPDGTPRLEVVFGAAAVAGAARIGVTTGGLVGMVAAGPASPVGVEVTLDRRPGAPAESTERFARIMPAAGGMAWQPVVADGVAAAEQTVAAGQAIVWRSGAADAASIRPAPTPPDWLAGRPLGDGIDRQAAQSLLPRLAAGVPAKPALRDLADGRRPEQRLAAAATLAVLGEFDELARLLTADGPAALRDGQWERLDLVAVQPTLARGPKAADAFAQAIAAHGPPGSADTIVRFARGLGDDEVAAGGDAELVAALESPHLAVRRYAIANLVGITGAGNADRLHYRADWPDADLRAKGVAWWRTRLEQGRIRRGGAER